MMPRFVTLHAAARWVATFVIHLPSPLSLQNMSRGDEFCMQRQKVSCIVYRAWNMIDWLISCACCLMTWYLILIRSPTTFWVVKYYCQTSNDVMPERGPFAVLHECWKWNCGLNPNSIWTRIFFRHGSTELKVLNHAGQFYQREGPMVKSIHSNKGTFERVDRRVAIIESLWRSSSILEAGQAGLESGKKLGDALWQVGLEFYFYNFPGRDEIIPFNWSQNHGFRLREFLCYLSRYGQLNIMDRKQELSYPPNSENMTQRWDQNSFSNNIHIFI